MSNGFYKYLRVDYFGPEGTAAEYISRVIREWNLSKKGLRRKKGKKRRMGSTGAFVLVIVEAKRDQIREISQ